MGARGFPGLPLGIRAGPRRLHHQTTSLCGAAFLVSSSSSLLLELLDVRHEAISAALDRGPVDMQDWLASVYRPQCWSTRQGIGPQVLQGSSR